MSSDKWTHVKWQVGPEREIEWLSPHLEWSFLCHCIKREEKKFEIIVNYFFNGKIHQPKMPSSEILFAKQRTKKKMGFSQQWQQQRLIQPFDWAHCQLTWPKCGSSIHKDICIIYKLINVPQKIYIYMHVCMMYYIYIFNIQRCPSDALAPN